MTDRELIQAVRDRAAGDAGAADAGLAATLEALGARLAGGSVDELAGALPPEAAAALLRGRTPEPQRGSLTDVADVVASATGTDPGAAANLVQASLRAVAGAVGQEPLDRIRDQLPSDLARMLQPAEEGDTSALQTGA